MNNKYDTTDMRTVNQEGFVTPTFWDRSIRLMTIDENGMAVDCYDRVVDDLKNKETNVFSHFHKEERKNKLINFVYNMQKRLLITNVICTVVTFIMYMVFVVCGHSDIIYKTDAMLAAKLYSPIYTKICNVVSPFNNAVQAVLDSYGLENIYHYALAILSVLSIVSLVAYMFGRDHVTVRWANRLLRIKPLCTIKAESDKKVNRLKSDLYQLQLRQHKVKYATHER